MNCILNNPYLGEKILNYLSEEGLLHLEKNLPEGNSKKIIQDEIEDIRTWFSDLLHSEKSRDNQHRRIDGIFLKRNVIRIEEFTKFAIKDSYQKEKFFNFVIAGAMYGYPKDLIEKYLIPHEFEVCQAIMDSMKNRNVDVFRWILRKFNHHIYRFYIGGWIINLEDPNFVTALIEEDWKIDWVDYLYDKAQLENCQPILNHLRNNYRISIRHHRGTEQDNLTDQTDD